MYQSLIWVSVTRDDPRRLSTSFDSEDLECLANALVYGVRRNAELNRDFLRIEMLVDEEETVELALAQASDALRHRVSRVRAVSLVRHVVRPLQFIQCNPHPAQMRLLPS
jgi:hypothetical protein